MVANVALVDIDGCLVQDGKLNMVLVERLKSGGYNHIALFTQRSKFMMYQRWMRGESPSESSLFLTPDIVDALANKGLTVTVSTSVDHCFGDPLAYFDAQLASFERSYEPLLSAYKPSESAPLTVEQTEQMIGLRKAILAELKDIAITITPDMVKAMAEANIKDGDQKALANYVAKQLQERPTATKEMIEGELIADEIIRLNTQLASIKATDVERLSGNLDELASLIGQWSAFHPTSKVIQKQEFDKSFPAAQVDYFDDYVENIVEIHKANPGQAPASFVVQGAFIVPLEIYQAKAFANNADGRQALKAALAFDHDTFTVDDIVGYLAHQNPGIQAFGRQLLEVAAWVFGTIKGITGELMRFQDLMQHDLTVKENQLFAQLIADLQQRPLPAELSNGLDAGRLASLTTVYDRLKATLLLDTGHPNELPTQEGLRAHLGQEGLSGNVVKTQGNTLSALKILAEVRTSLADKSKFERDIKIINAQTAVYQTLLNPEKFKALITDIYSAQQLNDTTSILRGLYALDMYVTETLGKRQDRNAIVQEMMSTFCCDLTMPNSMAHEALVAVLRKELDYISDGERLAVIGGQPVVIAKLPVIQRMESACKLYGSLLNYHEMSVDDLEPEAIEYRKAMMGELEAEAAPLVTQCVEACAQEAVAAEVETFLSKKSIGLDATEGFARYLAVNQSPLISTATQWQDYHQSRPAFHYQQFLEQAAVAQAISDPKSYRFDPQMHLLTNVTLTDTQYQEIIARILVARGEKAAPAGATRKEQLEALLGQSISETTICNIDISKNDVLLNRFKEWATEVVDDSKRSFPSTYARAGLRFLGIKSVTERVRAEDVADFASKLEDAVETLATRGSEAGSVIALQEEMDMHLGLALRVFEKAFALDERSKEATKDKWPLILQAAQQEMSAKVRVMFQQALVGSFKDGKIDFDQLSKTLDQMREPLSGKCRAILMQKCHEHIPHFKTRCNISVINQAISRHAFEATTATAHDYFSTTALGLNAHVSGTENTAHHKAAGEGHQALRILSYDDGSVMLRAPSIPDVENKSISLADHINDTAVKIGEIVGLMNPRVPPSYTGPIILNRETSLPYWGKSQDDKKNKQTLRFEIEVKAIHQYNAGRGDRRLMLMQAIPVNQHTQALSHTSSSAMVREATLMAEMAMLANLTEQFKGDTKFSAAYASVLKEYQSFLEENVRQLHEATFSGTTQGGRAIAVLQDLKTQLKADLQASVNTVSPAADMKALASMALQQIFANDLHHDPAYGLLVQALSTFTQKATAAGCKSANERFSAVESRAVLMRLLNINPCQLPQAKAAMEAALRGLIDSPDGQSVKANMAALQSTMNHYHNKHTVQIRAAAGVSCLDQGFAAKLQTFKTFVQTWFSAATWLKSPAKWNWLGNANTNFAENTDMTRLHAEGAGAGQAHKVKVEKYHKEITGLPGNVERRVFAKESAAQQLTDFLTQELNRFSWRSLFETRSSNRLHPEQKQQLQNLVNDLHNPLVGFNGADLLQKIKGILDQSHSQSCLQRFNASGILLLSLTLPAMGELKSPANLMHTERDLNAPKYVFLKSLCVFLSARRGSDQTTQALNDIVSLIKNPLSQQKGTELVAEIDKIVAKAVRDDGEKGRELFTAWQLKKMDFLNEKAPSELHPVQDGSKATSDDGSRLSDVDLAAEVSVVKVDEYQFLDLKVDEHNVIEIADDAKTHAHEFHAIKSFLADVEHEDLVTEVSTSEDTSFGVEPDYDRRYRSVSMHSDMSDDGEVEGLRLSTSTSRSTLVWAKGEYESAKLEDGDLSPPMVDAAPHELHELQGKLRDQLSSHFDATQLDHRDEQHINYALEKSSRLVASLSAVEQSKLEKMLPPAKSVSEAESSVASEQSLFAKTTEVANRLAVKYGPLAVAVAAFVMSKGGG